MSEQMRHLNKKGTHFKEKEQWTLKLEDEFVKLKEDLCTAFVREPFNIDKKVLVHT